MVYVLSINKQPLMPCKEAKARHLLRDEKAFVIKIEPFVIQLNFECENQTLKLFGASPPVFRLSR